MRLTRHSLPDLHDVEDTLPGLNVLTVGEREVGESDVLLPRHPLHLPDVLAGPLVKVGLQEQDHDLLADPVPVVETVLAGVPVSGFIVTQLLPETLP